MRKAKPRWLWLLVPLVGIEAALALPPLDEYAPLDRMGTRYDPREGRRPTVPPHAAASVRTRIERMNGQIDRREAARFRILGIGRHRAWKIHAPEADARRALGPLFSTRSRWRAMGGGTSSTSYLNDETGDHAEVVYDARPSPGRLETTVEIEVFQTEASLRPWALAGRWARRVGL